MSAAPRPARGAGEAPVLAAALADFAAELRADRIPEPVRERARLMILDAIGIALASTGYPFARSALEAIRELAGPGGEAPVIGLPERLPLRDAALLNGLLVHGLDFDDTHTEGVVHATASVLPCALAAGFRPRAAGADVLAAFVLGVEVAARLGAVARGGFHQVGHHPTGLVGAFACALVAGRLAGLSREELARAQGIVLSFASGSLAFAETGGWTKRLHPGWAAVSGLSAAALARRGFLAPREPYAGHFGLYPSHLGEYAASCDYERATAGLGRDWELLRVALKPFPACHFTHACMDAAIRLAGEHDLRAEDVREVRALVPAEVVATVCEPVASKKAPATDYEAQFSIPYLVAASLVRRRFGLAELEDATLHDPTVRELAQRVEYEVDPGSGFPTYYSGELVVTLRDGRVLRHREHRNRGCADRPLPAEDVEAKFLENAQRALSREAAERIRERVLRLEETDAGALAEALAAPAAGAA